MLFLFLGRQSFVRHNAQIQWTPVSDIINIVPCAGKITFLHGVAWRDVDWLSGFAAAKINFKCSDESFLSLTCLQWEWHPVQEIPRILRRIMTKHSQYEGSPLAWGHEGDRLCGPALELKERKNFSSGSFFRRMERIKPFRSECDQYPSTSMLWQPKWRESQSQSSFSIRCWRNIWTPILQEKTQGSSSRRFSRTEGNNEAKVDVIVPIRCQCQCQCINASMGEKKKESGFSSFLFFLSFSSFLLPLPLPLSAPPAAARERRLTCSLGLGLPLGSKKKKPTNENEKEKKEKMFWIFREWRKDFSRLGEIQKRQEISLN